MKNEKITYVAPEAEISEFGQEDIVLYSVDTANTRNLDNDASYDYSNW